MFICFINKITNETIYRMSLEGTFKGEIESTKELLAHENNINESDIKVRIQ